MMSWRKRRPIWKAGSNAIARSLRKNRSARKQKCGESERNEKQVESVPLKQIRRGSAAAQCGEALPRRRALFKLNGVEAEPRLSYLKRILSVSQRLTALWSGRTAILISFFLLSASCLLPTPLAPSGTVGLLFRAFSQVPQPDPKSTRLNSS